MKFKKEILRAVVYDHALAVRVEDRIIGTTRWSILHEMIFCNMGKYYKVQYSIAATELQDEQPFEHAADEIECPEVEPIEIIVTQWIELKE